MSVITSELVEKFTDILKKDLPDQAAREVVIDFAGQPEFTLGARPSSEEELRDHLEHIAEEYDRIVAPNLQGAVRDADKVKFQFLRGASHELRKDVSSNPTNDYKSPLLKREHQLEALQSGKPRIQCLAAKIIADAALLSETVPCETEVIPQLVHLLENHKNMRVRLAASRSLADISRNQAEWGFDYPDTIPYMAINEPSEIQREILYLNQQMVSTCNCAMEDLTDRRRKSVFRIVMAAGKCLDSEDQNVAKRAAEIINLASKKDYRFVLDIIDILYERQNDPNPIAGAMVDSVLARLDDVEDFDLKQAIGSNCIEQKSCPDTERPETTTHGRKYRGSYAIQ